MVRRPPGRTDPRVTLGLAVVLAVTLACGIGQVGEDPGAAPPVTATDGTDVDGTDTVEEFEGDAGDAVGLAEQYWAARFEASGQRFEPVRRIRTYSRDGQVDCGGLEVPRNNAVYCSAGDFIAYDLNWAFAAFRQIGDAFVFYLLGHEYAHAIQVRLGIRYDYTIQQELQADCMAGAFLGDSVRDETLRLDDGDLDEFRDGLFAVADDPDQPWFAEGAHGTARQRTDAFFAGYERSLDACDLG
nr:neutral zinc metallopeptidase [Micromonospora sp. DSM 115978]